jgi:hypothetical protein
VTVGKAGLDKGLRLALDGLSGSAARHQLRHAVPREALVLVDLPALRIILCLDQRRQCFAVVAQVILFTLGLRLTLILVWNSATGK